MNFLRCFVILLTLTATAQSRFSIKGHFNGTANKEVILKGYEGLDEISLDKSTTDSTGKFSLTYPADYIGAALIQITNGKSLIVLLNHENFEISWNDQNTMTGLRFTNSPENIAFDAGLLLYKETQEKRYGITYLLPYYANDDTKSRFFNTELNELSKAVPSYLNSLSSKSYVSYYLTIRVLLANMQTSLKRYPDQIPELEKQFNNLNFADERLLYSGLYSELLETFLITIENHYGKTKFDHLNKGIQVVLKSVSSIPESKQDIAEYLFNLLEKRSLFEASEKLALSMLNDESCPLDEKHQALFEQYRKMGNGKTAPDLLFANAKGTDKNLYSLKNKYKLVVFGASWCPKCVSEIPNLTSFYKDWKTNNNLEVIFISLDTNQQEYNNFTANFPWISSCDFKGWNTTAAKDYCVFATPTMYLLDANSTILLKPISADQINSWLAAHQ